MAIPRTFETTDTMVIIVMVGEVRAEWVLDPTISTSHAKGHAKSKVKVTTAQTSVPDNRGESNGDCSGRTAIAVGGVITLGSTMAVDCMEGAIGLTLVIL